MSTGWKVRVSNLGRGNRVFSSRKRPDRLCGAPSRLHFNFYRNSFPGIKRPGRDVDHSPPSTTEIMNERSHTSTPPACLQSSLSMLSVIKTNTFYLFSTTHCSHLRLIVRSGLDVPSFATRRLHACHHATAPSGGRWNCGREMSCNFA